MRRSRASKLKKESQLKKAGEKRKSTLSKSKNILTATAMVLLTSVIQPFTPVRAESLGSSTATASSSASSSESAGNDNTSSSTSSGSEESSQSGDTSSENSSSASSSESAGNEDSSSFTSSGSEEGNQSGDTSNEDSTETPSLTGTESSGEPSSTNHVDSTTSEENAQNTNASQTPADSNEPETYSQRQSQTIETNPSQHQTVPSMDSAEAEQSQEIVVVNDQHQQAPSGQEEQSQQTTVSTGQNQNAVTQGNSSIEQSTSADINTRVDQSTNNSPSSTNTNQNQTVNSRLEQEQRVITESGAQVSQGQGNDIVAAQQGNLTQNGNVTAVQVQAAEINGTGAVNQRQTNQIQLGQIQYQYDAPNEVTGDINFGQLQGQGAEITLQQQQSASTLGDSLKLVQAQGVNLDMTQTMGGNAGSVNVSQNSIIEMVKQATNTLVQITQRVKFDKFEEVLNWGYTLDDTKQTEVKEKEYSWNFDWGKVQLNTKIDTSAVMDKLSASLESLLSVIYNEVDSDTYNWLLEDHDGDGILNGEEQALGLDPYKVSSGDDGIPDMVRWQLLQQVIETDSGSVDLFKGLLFQSLPAMNTQKERAAIPQVLNGVLINPLEESEVKKSIIENLEAIRLGDVKEYMKYISSQAGAYEQTQQSITDIFEKFDLDVKVDQIQILQANNNEVKVLVQQTTNKLNGPEFKDNRTQIIHTLVKEDGIYKILNSNVVQMEAIEQ